MMAVATAAAKPAPGMFSFLKDGVVISARRCGLFLMVFALNACLSTALQTFDILVVPGEKIGGYINAGIKESDDGAVAASTVEDADQYSFSKLWLPLIAYLVLDLAVGLVKKVATASAAVAACSGERHTLGSFLRKVGGNLQGVSATIAFGHVIRTACAIAIAASIVALTAALVFWGNWWQLFLLDALFAALAFQFYFYLDVVCTMAVVPSVAAPEPGRRGALSAVARAWRAMAAGTSGRAFLYALVTLSLDMAVPSVSKLAMSRLPHGMDTLQVSMLVDSTIKYVVEVFSVVAITAYYFECRNRKEEKADHAD